MDKINDVAPWEAHVKALCKDIVPECDPNRVFDLLVQGKMDLWIEPAENVGDMPLGTLIAYPLYDEIMDLTNLLLFIIHANGLSLDQWKEKFAQIKEYCTSSGRDFKNMVFYTSQQKVAQFATVFKSRTCAYVLIPITNPNPLEITEET